MIFAISGLPTPVDNTVIGAITKDSPASRAELQPGDVITSINRRPVTDLKDFGRLVKSIDDEILINIQRGNGAFFLLLR